MAIARVVPVLPVRDLTRAMGNPGKIASQAPNSAKPFNTKALYVAD
jgi:hypothetical protein